jgi:hypothetical protein
LDHGAFDGRYRHIKAASSFSHGQTVSRRSHQAFFQVGRIGTHTALLSITHDCLRLLQVALIEHVAAPAGLVMWRRDMLV